MARSEVSGKKFLSKRHVATRYAVTPRSIDRWVKAEVFPPADLVINSRRYWDEAGLDRHDRKSTAAAAGANHATATVMGAD